MKRLLLILTMALFVTGCSSGEAIDNRSLFDKAYRYEEKVFLDEPSLLTVTPSNVALVVSPKRNSKRIYEEKVDSFGINLPDYNLSDKYLLSMGSFYIGGKFSYYGSSYVSNSFAKYFDEYLEGTKFNERIEIDNEEAIFHLLTEDISYHVYHDGTVYKESTKGNCYEADKNISLFKVIIECYNKWVLSDNIAHIMYPPVFESSCTIQYRGKTTTVEKMIKYCLKRDGDLEDQSIFLNNKSLDLENVMVIKMNDQDSTYYLTTNNNLIYANVFKSLVNENDIFAFDFEQSFLVQYNIIDFNRLTALLA